MKLSCVFIVWLLLTSLVDAQTKVSGKAKLGGKVTAGTVSQGGGSDFFASTTGTSTAAGTIGDPWDLQTALNKTSVIGAGSRLFLRGGTYSGSFTSTITSAGTAITVRSYPGEWAKLNGFVTAPLTNTIDASTTTLTLTNANAVFAVGRTITIDSENMQIFGRTGSVFDVNRGWDGTAHSAHTAGATAILIATPVLSASGRGVIFRDFEVYHSGTVRTWPAGVFNTQIGPQGRGGAVAASVSGVKFVNLIIHDLAGGVGMEPDAGGSGGNESYGNIVYNIGYAMNNNAEGAGFAQYNQNNTSQPITFRNGIIFGCFNGSIQFVSSSSGVKHFFVDGNAVLNHGGIFFGLTGSAARGYGIHVDVNGPDSTPLTTTIDASTTTVVLDSPSSLFQVGVTMIIGSEHMLINSRSGTGPVTFTVTRGTDGTTAAGHTAGAAAFPFVPSTADDINITNNYFYNPLNTFGTHMLVGGGQSGLLTPKLTAAITGNYIAGGSIFLATGGWQNLTVTGNTLVAGAPGNGEFAQLGSFNLWPSTTTTWNSNTYYNNSPLLACVGPSRRSAFTFMNAGVPVEAPDGCPLGYSTPTPSWQSASGFDATGSSYAETADPNAIFYRGAGNPYESGRGHIIAYNWSGASSLTLDLSQVGLQSGQAYQIRDAQNPLSAALASGTYAGGNVVLSLAGVSATTAVPIGWSYTPPNTCPQVCTLIVVPINANTSLP